MGLDIYLSWEGQTDEERKARYTGFTTTGAAGYLRSSYNDGGFNQWCRRHLGASGFYHIFDYDDGKEVSVGKDEYGDETTGFFPDWAASRQRTEVLLQKARGLDHLTTIRVTGPHSPPGTEMATDETVLDAYRAMVAQRPSFDWFSNWQGLWMLKEPPTVKAALWAKVFSSQPDLILICDSEENPHEHYIKVLEETLAFISLGEQKQGWLGWSG